MPEQDDSTPPRVATPPRILPHTWEDFPTFRETLLMYFTEPAGNAALRVVGRMLHELTLQYCHLWPVEYRDLRNWLIYLADREAFASFNPS